MDKKVDISGHVPVIPSTSNKSVNCKKDIGRRGVVDIVPQLKTKLLYSRYKIGFDESIDKRRLSVVSLPDWLAYLTSFSLPIRIQDHASVAVVANFGSNTPESLWVPFFTVLIYPIFFHNNRP